MERTIERLLKGDSTLNAHVKKALQLWDEILDGVANISDNELGKNAKIS